MKKNYEAPVIELFNYGEQDIITASDNQNPDHESIGFWG